MPQAIPLHSHTHTHTRTSPRSISFVQDCCSGAAAARDTRVRAKGIHHNRGKCKRIQSLCPSVQLISSSFFLGHGWLLRRPPLCARVGPHSRHASADIACLSTSGIAQGRVAPHPASCQTLSFFCLMVSIAHTTTSSTTESTHSCTLAHSPSSTYPTPPTPFALHTTYTLAHSRVRSSCRCTTPS
jgi:hypothetical protein